MIPILNIIGLFSSELLNSNSLKICPEDKIIYLPSSYKFSDCQNHLNISHNIFEKARLKYKKLNDSWLFANKNNIDFINCSDFLTRMSRSKVFNYLFMEMVVKEYCNEYNIHVYTDDQLLGMSINLLDEKPKVFIYSTNSFKAFLSKYRVILLIYGCGKLLRALLSVFKRYWITLKIRGKVNCLYDTNTLIVSSDIYFPWNGTATHLNDRIWGNLHERIAANLAIIHRSDPRNYKYVNRKNTVSLFLLNGIKDLIKSVIFRIKVFFIFIINIWGRINKNTSKNMMLFISPLLLNDCLYNAPNWFECHISLKDFLEDCDKIKNIVYFGEFGGWGKMAALAAKKVGRKSIAYAHGFYFDAHLQYHFTKVESDLTVFPDALCLWSKRTLEIIEKYAEYKPNTHIVGTARIQPKVKSHNKNRGNKKFVGLLPSTGEFPSLIQYVLQHNKILSKFDFVVKPHPTKLKHFEEQFLPKISEQENIFVYDGQDINHFFNKVDCLIIGCSTAGVEALLRCIPVIVATEIVPYGFGQATLVNHDPERGVYLAKNPEDILHGINLFRMRKHNCNSFWDMAHYYVDELKVDKLKNIIASI